MPTEAWLHLSYHVKMDRFISSHRTHPFEEEIWFGKDPGRAISFVGSTLAAQSNVGRTASAFSMIFVHPSFPDKCLDSEVDAVVAITFLSASFSFSSSSCL